MSLAWQRISAWAETSGDPIRYSVSASKVDIGYKFQAWRWPQKAAGEKYAPMQVLLGTFDSAERARECCERDDERDVKTEAA